MKRRFLWLPCIEITSGQPPDGRQQTRFAVSALIAWVPSTCSISPPWSLLRAATTIAADPCRGVTVSSHSNARCTTRSLGYAFGTHHRFVMTLAPWAPDPLRSARAKRRGKSNGIRRWTQAVVGRGGASLRGLQFTAWSRAHAPPIALSSTSRTASASAGS